VAAFLASADEAAFRRLYAGHTPRLYLSLLRLCGGREAEAEEILQETWIRAASSLASFRWQSALRTWLFGIALNAWREAARTKQRSGVSLESLPEEPPARAGHASYDERLDLELAVRRLPEGSREVFLLHDVEGHTHEEIAGMLDIVPGTSKSQLARAHAFLRRELARGEAQDRKEGIS